MTDLQELRTEIYGLVHKAANSYANPKEDSYSALMNCLDAILTEIEAALVEAQLQAQLHEVSLAEACHDAGDNMSVYLGQRKQLVWDKLKQIQSPQPQQEPKG